MPAIPSIRQQTNPNPQVTTVGFDANAGDNVNAKNQNGANPPNSAYILASFHNSPNRVTSLQQSITVTAKNNQIVAGQANQLTLSSGGNNVVLGGVLIYGVDGAGTRQGSFTDAGKTFFTHLNKKHVTNQNI